MELISRDKRAFDRKLKIAEQSLDPLWISHVPKGKGIEAQDRGVTTKKREEMLWKSRALIFQTVNRYQMDG